MGRGRGEASYPGLAATLPVPARAAGPRRPEDV